ncbi:MAG: xanthan lyase [Bacteroidales bacterium]|nr:xanthan lyase [Bacteroidales bacterium]
MAEGANAQELPAETTDAIADCLTGIVRSQTRIARVKIDSMQALKKNLRLFASESLSYMPFDKTMVDSIYMCIKSLLPTAYKNHAVELYSDGYRIEDYIPLFRKERFLQKPGLPLVTNLSMPVTAGRGLQGRHIAMWQSHGWYYEEKLQRWEWQRARLFQTVEDLFTQSFVLPFLVPMLENAGANVLLPRERDTQRHEIIVDNDKSVAGDYRESSGKEPWHTGAPGFAPMKKAYLERENPFRDGTFRQVKTVKKGAESSCEWMPDIPEKGHYAVYISYASFANSAPDAHYTVYHTGGQTEFRVNQTMSGGTWVFLGYFMFDKGKNERCRIVLSNKSSENNRIITADAVKIGGGMGNVARGATPEISGYPRYTEGARYWLQWAGIPDSVYRWTKDGRDYTDDYQSRGLWVNYMAGGSSVNPRQRGGNVPFDAVLAFHSDAGITYNDSIIGTLGICMTHYHDERFASGAPRILSRDLTSVIMNQIVNDIRHGWEPQWTRRQIWNRSYSEARLPEAPTMLLELLSHQNFADMRYGLDPAFRFDVSRAIYKGFLKFIAFQNRQEYVVQPLPVKAFAVQFSGEHDVELTWTPTLDSLEATAIPTGYIVQTAVGDNDFDNGTYIRDTRWRMPVVPDSIYRFRVIAANDGGRSFPSETLSACRKKNGKGIVLIANGFHRISGPDSFTTKDSLAGFIDFMDHGVPCINEYNYIGRQFEYRRRVAWMDDDAGGFGASNADFETTVVVGNTFDYPYMHGQSIAAAGYSFVSANTEAVINGAVKLADYRIVDLILGKQKQILRGRGAFPPVYKTFPDSLQSKITAYCQQGGNIFVSGAFVGSDLWDTPFVNEADKDFTRRILRYQWRTGHASVTGKVKSVNADFDGNYEFHSRLNTEFYAVESPDAIEPSNPAKAEGLASTVFRYSENNLSAGVACSGPYKTVVLGFPFESVKGGVERNQLMNSILQWLK